MKESALVKDTRNQTWAEDKSKFGYRMLQKMGWNEGKGLGVKEDGVTQHVRVKKKNTNTGIGAEKSAAKLWEKPGQVAGGLNDVLARLSAVHTPNTVAKKERVAKKGRGYFERRAHGKNVSGYSDDALAEIFGGVSAKSDATTKSEPKMEEKLLPSAMLDIAAENTVLIKTESTVDDGAENKIVAKRESLLDFGAETAVFSEAKVSKEKTEQSAHVKEESCNEDETKEGLRSTKAEKKRLKREKREKSRLKSLAMDGRIEKKKKSKKRKKNTTK